VRISGEGCDQVNRIIIDKVYIPIAVPSYAIECDECRDVFDRKYRRALRLNHTSCHQEGYTCIPCLQHTSLRTENTTIAMLFCNHV
jgi:hypothetical protein